MPHVVIEYSANLEAEVEPMALVTAVHRAVLEQPAFEAPGVRTRASRREHYLVAEGDPENAFIAVTARVGPGRDSATRKAASEAIMAALYRVVEPIYRRRGLALSVEVTELDAAGMTRRNNLRARAARDRA
ncbi:MAG TPA: 5-carboxymethyl-2-hydroxymuconate isomerase [Roseiarcus sp.]|jgi:5-carboxymethyl-2-hydroxymuconate isomerase|nr:5-carboxymethyl-2-hydroxymuconate isomerase [Roseiarcus sp.]